MSEKKNPLEEMLAQYAKNETPQYEKKEAKTYDLKNYFTTFIEDKVKSANKRIRVLPSADGSSPFVEVMVHKFNVGGVWKTFTCLEHEKGEKCPFCEAHEILKTTGDAQDKEEAKKYKARKVYVVKVIDRDNEDDGVKFWRFSHDFRKEGIMDKIHGIIQALKKDITHPQTGRDLVINVGRNQLGKPTVSSISQIDPTPLSEDSELANAWLSDSRTWEDVYAVKPYGFLEIIVKGGTPVWDNDVKGFVDKDSKDGKTDTTEDETTLGLETLKNELTTPTSEESPQTEEEDDDMPF